MYVCIVDVSGFYICIYLNTGAYLCAIFIINNNISCMSVIYHINAYKCIYVLLVLIWVGFNAM